MHSHKPGKFSLTYPDCMKTKAFRKKLMADLKSVTKSCLKLVEKIYATENEKKMLANVIIQYFVAKHQLHLYKTKKLNDYHFNVGLID